MDEYEYLLTDILLNRQEYEDLEKETNISEQINQYVNNLNKPEKKAHSYSYCVKLKKESDTEVSMTVIFKESGKNLDKFYNLKYFDLIKYKVIETKIDEDKEIKALKIKIREHCSNWEKSIIEFLMKFSKQLTESEKYSLNSSVLLFGNKMITDGMILLDIESSWDHLRDMESSNKLVMPLPKV